MPRFRVTGKGHETGRIRNRVYDVPTEAAAYTRAVEDGLEVAAIVPLPAESPTERQLIYAKDLGLLVPVDASKEDVSGLISLTVDHDKPAELRHRAFAEAFGIDVPRFIGKKSLFDRVQDWLREPGREADLMAWFIFRVYRHLVRGQKDAPIDSPNDTIIQDIARSLANNESIARSIRRYQGRDLIWFGEWTAPSGVLYRGGSTQTIAYQTCSTLLRQKLNIPHAKPKEKLNVPHAKELSSSAAGAAPLEGRAWRGWLWIALAVALIAWLGRSH